MPDPARPEPQKIDPDLSLATWRRGLLGESHQFEKTFPITPS